MARGQEWMVRGWDVIYGSFSFRAGKTEPTIYHEGHEVHEVIYRINLLIPSFNLFSLKFINLRELRVLRGK